jgi:predicted transcriptional regulator
VEKRRYCMNIINLTDEELELLKEFVEEHLDERSPTPTITMKNLALKINLSAKTHIWIDRKLNR